MRIESYSLARDGEKKLSANFRAREFACKDGSNTIFVCDELVQLLQNIRDHFNRPVTITSAYRTVTHNKKVGGSPKSQHLYCGRHPGKGHAPGVRGPVRRNAAAEHRRHRPVPEEERPGQGLGACGHPAEKE